MLRKNDKKLFTLYFEKLTVFMILVLTFRKSKENCFMSWEKIRTRIVLLDAWNGVGLVKMFGH